MVRRVAQLALRDQAVGLLSRKWTLRIVVALGTGMKRHSELTRILPDITQKVLTETLREMERTGIVERSIFPTIPPRVEYKLTESGFGLLKLSESFADWFDTYQNDLHTALKAYDQRMATELT
jgi:DNA-binding HxlR family transcriptional regulator